MNLLAYQIASCARLVAAVLAYGFGLDASETGVGKTHIACAACRQLGLRLAVLCPKTVIPVWRKACREWGLPVPVFVLNYESLRTGRSQFLTWTVTGRSKVAAWHLPPGTLLVFDEVHRCAGQDSLNSKMLAAVRRYGIPTICLSATAAESPLKLRALGFAMRLHDDGESFWRFCAAHGCMRNFWGGIEFPTGVARPGSRRAFQIERARQGLGRLHEGIFRPVGRPPKGTRVRIADLGEAFPPTLVTAEAYDFGEAVQGAYQAATDGTQYAGMNALVALLRGRQQAELLKAPGLAEMATDGVAEGQSVVMFVNFRATLTALRDAMPDLAVIEGDTPMDERADILRRFGADEVRVVAVNIATAGEGLDGLQDLRGEFPRLTLISPGFKAWGAAADPIADVDDAILSVIKAAKYGSLMGVGVLFGATAWKIFKNQAAVRGRFVVGNGRGKSDLGLAVPTEQSAGQMFIGTPDVRTSYMIYDANPEGKAESINFLLDTAVLVFARKAAPSRRDPSFMKTFRLMNKFMVPGSYMRDDGRVEVAKFDWSEDVKVTNSAACVRYNITLA